MNVRFWKKTNKLGGALDFGNNVMVTMLNNGRPKKIKLTKNFRTTTTKKNMRKKKQRNKQILHFKSGLSYR